MNWSEILTRKALRELAGSRSFAAGEEYAMEGAVSGLLTGDKTLTAHVQGSERYRVRLEVDQAGHLLGDCSCPFGREGNFCKHCVAVGIAWLENANDPNASSRPATVDSLRAYLKTLTPEQLIALLLEQVTKDDDLQNQLLLKIAQAAPNGPDVAAYRKSIERAVRIRGYLDYDEVSGYADGIEKITNSLQELLANGFAEEARGLAEYALSQVAEPMNQVDDSDGEVHESWQQLHALHLEATLESPGDTETLAEWLFQNELNSDWDLDTDWTDYLPALGKTGEAYFRQRAETAWAAVPQMKATDKPSYGGNRHSITNLMERLAHADDDLPRLIAIKQRDLTSSWKYFEIAQLYSKTGDETAALEWAEKGRSLFAENTDSRLLEFLVTQYTARKRYAEAYAILWEGFQNRPALAAYQKLRDYATERGEWETWRARSWEHLRETLKQKQNKPQSSPLWAVRPPDHSELVTILLWEGRNDEAWQEANAGGCSRELWLRLAGGRELSHPQDALRIYQEEVLRQLQSISNGDYGEPLKLLLKMRGILTKTGDEARLKAIVSGLRLEYKRKRNFIKALDENRFPA